MVNQIKEPTLLRVIDVVADEDSNTKPYHIIRVSTLGVAYRDIPGVGQVAVKGDVRTGTTIAYPENYLGRPDDGAMLEKGDFTEGNIVTVKTTPYSIEDASGNVRSVSEYTFVVFGNDTDEVSWKRKIRDTFNRKMSFRKADGTYGLRAQLNDPRFVENVVAAPVAAIQEEEMEEAEIINDLDVVSGDSPL